MSQEQRVTLTPARVNQALGKLALDFERVIRAADRRIPGPALQPKVLEWAEGLAEAVLEVKGVDIAVLEQDAATSQSPGGRAGPQGVPCPDPAFSKRRTRQFEDSEIPDWLAENWPDAQGYIMRPGGCIVLVGQHVRHGWHLHLAHMSRLPTWAEMYDAQCALIPPDVMMSMMFYPIDWSIDYPANRFTLFEVRPQSIPRFVWQAARNVENDHSGS